MPYGIYERTKQCRENLSKAQKERNIRLGPTLHQNWRGGKISCNGYVAIYKPQHPFCDGKGYVFEHRLIMEQKIGRYLLEEERVHHINKNKKDNQIVNLMLFPNESEHQKHHHRIKK